MNDIKKGKRNEMNQLYGSSCYMRSEKKNNLVGYQNVEFFFLLNRVVLILVLLIFQWFLDYTDLDDDIADTLEQFEKKIRRHVLHTVAFY